MAEASEMRIRNHRETDNPRETHKNDKSPVEALQKESTSRLLKRKNNIHEGEAKVEHITFR